MIEVHEGHVHRDLPSILRQLKTAGRVAVLELIQSMLDSAHL